MNTRFTLVSAKNVQELIRKLNAHGDIQAFTVLHVFREHEVWMAITDSFPVSVVVAGDEDEHEDSTYFEEVLSLSA